MVKPDKRQFTLPEILEKVSNDKIFLEKGIQERVNITPDSVIICGECGSAMRIMGPTRSKERVFNDYTQIISKHVYSCRNSVCDRPGSFTLEVEKRINEGTGEEVVESIRGYKGAGANPIIISSHNVEEFEEEDVFVDKKEFDYSRYQKKKETN